MHELDAISERLSYPMLAVAAAHAGERDACLVGFATQISIDPWRYLVGLSHRNRTFDLAAASSHLAVHFLSDDQHELARVLGSTSAHDDPEKERFLADLWDDADDTGDETAVSRLAPCRSWFVGRVVARHPCGDHWAFVLEPVAWSGADPRFRQLDYQQVRDLEAGRAP